MKKLTIEATEANVLDSIEHDTLQRTSDVREFLMMIDNIDYNAFIAIDAPWGEGKTFFVRQIGMTMNYFRNLATEHEIGGREKKVFQNNHILGDLEPKYTYLPIYFDAWLYDNHTDALMALLMVMIKQSDVHIDSKLNYDTGEIITSILDSIQFWKSSNWKSLYESLRGENIIEHALLLEEVRQKVKEIFNEILTEHADKLVIFVDELDRCRPNFAIEILESIKHYFDDDRIIFVMSVNKSQLIHTVAQYYGNDFDSSLYLNKFFDINIQLPKADTRIYFDTLGISCNDSYWINKFASDLQKQFSLSLRDTTRYFYKIRSIDKQLSSSTGTDSYTIKILFIPIICVLDIVDITKKQRFLSGDGFDILKKFIFGSEVAHKYVLRLSNVTEDTEENFQTGMDELEKIYEFCFRDKDKYGWYEGRLELYSDFYKECIRICNSV